MRPACVQAWIDRQETNICQCGCGEVIPIFGQHKYRGIPKFKHGHDSIAAWIDKQQNKHFCKCGCNEPIVIIQRHKYKGIPRFKLGHFKPSPPVIDDWVAENQGRHACACGCGEIIKITRNHRGNGIPKYIRYHHTPIEATVYKWIEANQGKHICACGCGQPIRITEQHHSKGISRFIHGHSKGLPLSIWVEQEQGKHHCVCGCGGVIPIREEHRKHRIPKFILGHNCQGASNPAWAGGLSQTYATRRRAIVPTHWREQILMRDEFQCAFGCPKDSPGPLHAHHIIGFAKQPELADKLWNGITLCEACHYSIKGSEVEHEEFFFNILSEA